MQKNISQKLMEEYGLKDDYNICIYRYPLFTTQKKINEKIFNKVYGIPFIESRYRILKWLNFFIYIFCFSLIFLRNPQKGTLVIGNLYYNANKFIINLFKAFWETIFILDEGTSTLLIYEDRSKFKSKIRLIDKVLFTYQPKRSLIFYTIFNLPPNQHDRIHRIENIFNLDQRMIQNKSKSKSLLFIGSYFVEENVLCEEEFNKLLYKLKINNPDIGLYYATHPREIYVYNNPVIKELGINLVRPEVSIEEYLLANYLDFQIIASCVSTGYIYANNMLGDLVDYQTYILNIKLPSGEIDPDYVAIYKAIKNKLIDSNSKEIKI